MPAVDCALPAMANAKEQLLMLILFSQYFLMACIQFNTAVVLI